MRKLNLEIYGALNDIYLLDVSFTPIVFSYIPRSANVRANQAAKQSLWTTNPT